MIEFVVENSTLVGINCIFQNGSQRHFKIHPDIVGLIMYSEGKVEGASKKKEGLVIKTFGNPMNPGAIYSGYAVDIWDGNERIKEPDYYPSYIYLTPKQRYKYFCYLENPYKSTSDLSYVYLLYYQLSESVIDEDSFLRFYALVRRLRSAFAKQSFLKNTFSDISKGILQLDNRALALEFLSEIDDDYENNSYLYLHYHFNVPFKPASLFKLARKYSYMNLEKKEKFEKSMVAYIDEKYNGELYLTDILSKEIIENSKAIRHKDYQMKLFEHKRENQRALYEFFQNYYQYAKSYK